MGQILTVTDPRFGAKGDGETDDTGAISDAFEAAAPGDVLHFPPNRVFIVDTIDLGERGKTDLTMDCRGATIRKNPRGRFGNDNSGHLFKDTQGSSDGLRVIGGHFDLSAQAGKLGDTVSAFFLVRCNRLFFALISIANGIEEGAKLYKCQDVTFVNPRIVRVRNNGIQCHSPAKDRFTGSRPNQGWKRWRIYGGSITEADDGRDGQADGEGITFNNTDPAVECEDALVEGVRVTDCLRGLWAEFNTPGSPGRNIIFRNNVVERPRWFGIGHIGVTDGQIVGNRVINPGIRAPGPETSSEVAGIIVSGTTALPSQGVSVKKNQVIDDRPEGQRFMEYGVVVKQANNTIVQENTVIGSTRKAFDIHSTASGDFQSASVSLPQT